MVLQVQYDMFQEFDELAEVNARIDEQKDSIRRTQRKFFAQNKELMTMVLAQHKQIEALEKRLNSLLRIK